VNSRIPIVLDTDIGTDIDDTLALLLALASPELRILGVTTVDGDVDLRARIASRLLGYAGRADIPVFRGRREPIGSGRMPTMMGHEGRGVFVDSYNGPEATIQDKFAEEWLVEASHNEPFHLVAIGPLTNIAAALEMDPTFGKRLLHITVMGGMVREESYPKPWRDFLLREGLDTAYPDHNTASDPNAALIVARSGVPMTWVTIETTLGTPLGVSGLERLRSIRNPLSGVVIRMLEIWRDQWSHLFETSHHGQRPFSKDKVVYLHDPLALSALFHGDWLTLQTLKLKFSIEDSIFHIHEVDKDEEAKHNVSVGVKAADFETFFLDRVLDYLSHG
jgi:purine nucleosidase